MTVQEQRDALVQAYDAVERPWSSDSFAGLMDDLIAAVRAEAESELLNTAVMFDVMTHAKRERALEAALRSIVICDLRDDFKDGDDIVLRWEGNKADWTAARALLTGEVVR